MRRIRLLLRDCTAPTDTPQTKHGGNPLLFPTVSATITRRRTRKKKTGENIMTLRQQLLQELRTQDEEAKAALAELKEEIEAEYFI